MREAIDYYPGWIIAESESLQSSWRSRVVFALCFVCLPAVWGFACFVRWLPAGIALDRELSNFVTGIRRLQSSDPAILEYVSGWTGILLGACLFLIARTGAPSAGIPSAGIPSILVGFGQVAAVHRSAKVRFILATFSLGNWVTLLIYFSIAHEWVIISLMIPTVCGALLLLLMLLRREGYSGRS